MVRRIGGTSLKGRPVKRKLPCRFHTLLVFRLLVPFALAQTGAKPSHAAGQQSSSSTESWAKVSSKIEINSAIKDESQTLPGVENANRGNDHRPSGHTRPRTSW